MSERRDTVLELLSLVSGRAVEDITPDLDLVADLGLDSPKAVRLLVELEDRFDAEIPDEEAARFSTVGDVLEYADSYDARP